MNEKQNQLSFPFMELKPADNFSLIDFQFFR